MNHQGGVDLWTSSTLNLTKGLSLGAPVLIGSIEGSGNIVLGASGSATFLSVGGNNRSTEFDGNITQAAGAAASALIKNGTGSLTLAGVNSYAGVTDVLGGSLIVNGTLGAGNVIVATTLGGNGVIGGSVTLGNSAHLAPGNAGATGVLSTGSLSLSGFSNFDVQLNGASAGTGYDQVNVTGSVNLDSDGSGGAILNLSLNFTPAPNSVITLINNDGTDAVSGNFQAPGNVPLNNGDPITIGSTTFRIFYTGGDGNDVVLVENSQPAVAYASAGNFGLAVAPNLGQSVDGDLGTAGVQSAIIGVNAFLTVTEAQTAISAHAVTTGTIIVNPGAYTETPTLIGTETLRLSGGDVTIDSLDASSELPHQPRHRAR